MEEIMKLKITMDNGDEYWLVTGNENFDIGHWLSDEISKEKYVELPTLNPGSNGPVKIWIKK